MRGAAALTDRPPGEDTLEPVDVVRAPKWVVYVAPSAGSVKLDDTPTWRHPDLYRSVGFVPEREAVYPFLTGRDHVRLQASLHGLYSIVPGISDVINTLQAAPPK